MEITCPRGPSAFERIANHVEHCLKNRPEYNEFIATLKDHGSTPSASELVLRVSRLAMPEIAALAGYILRARKMLVIVRTANDTDIFRHTIGVPGMCSALRGWMGSPPLEVVYLLGPPFTRFNVKLLKYQNDWVPCDFSVVYSSRLSNFDKYIEDFDVVVLVDSSRYSKRAREKISCRISEKKVVILEEN